MRPDWDDYFLLIAQAVSRRSTCLRRQYGAVIVKDKKIISTGYNGSPRGEDNCDELGWCLRDKLNTPHGADYSNNCTAVHAEMNAVIQADPKDLAGADIFIYGEDAKTHELVDAAPCYLCRRLIVNARLRRVVYSTASNSVSYLVNPRRDRIYYKINVRLGDQKRVLTTSAATNAREAREWAKTYLETNGDALNRLLESQKITGNVYIQDAAEIPKDEYDSFEGWILS